MTLHVNRLNTPMNRPSLSNYIRIKQLYTAYMRCTLNTRTQKDRSKLAPLSHCLNDCSFIIILNIWKCKSSILVHRQDYLGCSWPLVFPYKL